jgi:recombination protein RecA
VVGNRVRGRVKKNKVAPPFREAEFDIMYNEGISRVGDVLDLGVELDIIEKRGSWYSYGDEQLAQGRENAKQALREAPQMCLEVENAIRRHYNLRELDIESYDMRGVSADGDPVSSEPAEDAEMEQLED